MRLPAKRVAKDRIEKRFQKDNPGVAIEWVKPLRIVTYPTGWRGWLGTFRASAPGYRTRIMIADCDAHWVMIR
jgi:hypothetical protein